MKAQSGVQLSSLLWQPLHQLTQRAAVRARSSVAARAIMLATMDFWERRVAALLGGTKRKNAPKCKSTITTKPIPRLAKMRSASSAAAATQRIKRAPGGALSAYRCFGCAIEENGLAHL